MEIIEGRKLVAHISVFVRFPLIGRENEYILVWTTTPWTLTSNVAAAINVSLDYIKLKASDGSIYYFAKENLETQRLEKQFNEKNQWIDGVPKLKTIAQIFKEKGGYELLGAIKGKDRLGWKYEGPFDELEAQSESGGYPFVNEKLSKEGKTGISCHRVIDGGKDSIGNDVVVEGEGTGIVHTAPGCGAIDNIIAQKIGLVSIAPLNEESCSIDGFGKYSGKCATEIETTQEPYVRFQSPLLLQPHRCQCCLFLHLLPDDRIYLFYPLCLIFHLQMDTRLIHSGLLAHQMDLHISIPTYPSLLSLLIIHNHLSL
jgi:isoleucyl-tRNA synthetase